jgi:hypothetical protein
MAGSARKTIESLLTRIMVFLISFIILPLSLFAADDLWVVAPGGDPYWATSGNWSLGYEPGVNDNAVLSLAPSITSNTTVYYNSQANLTLGTITVDGINGYSLELGQSQGALSSTTQYIGYNGSGSYTQTGGTNTINLLYLGYNSGSSGTYNLSNGRLRDGITEYIGYSGNAIFDQTGGNNMATDIWLGYNSGSTFTYNLSGGDFGAICSEHIGKSGTGTFNQSGGRNGADVITLGAGSTYNLSGGDLVTIGQNIYGTFTQSGGTNRQSIFLQINGDKASYELSGNGSLVVSNNERIDDYSKFTQTGGTNSTGRLYLGSNSGSSGTYNLSGDTATSTLTVGNEYIGNYGNGTFTQSGGTHAVANTLTIAANPGSMGTYNLSGGSLQAGSLVNNDHLNYSGGELQANITNNGTFNLSGFGVRTVVGDVTNNGTVKVTNTIAQFTGTFTNNGAYLSDPSVSIFNNLIIGQNGYLQGNIDDLFVISGYLENYSTNSLWNTSDSLLGFTGAGLHNIYDTNDVHWGTLAIYDGLLSLAGTGNLYVDNIFGLTFDQTGAVSNIWGNGLNIYYDVAYTPWLNGCSYSLMGGGSLLAYNTQAPVPEPSTMLLLGAGLFGLAGFRKKLKR